MIGTFIMAFLLGQIVSQSVLGESFQSPQPQSDEYAAQRAKSIVELQQFRETTSISILNKSGQEGEATLINLNPQINSWFLLTLTWNERRDSKTYHLENRDPENQKILLDPKYPQGIVIATAQRKYACVLWLEPSTSDLTTAQESGKPYAPLCDERLYLLNKTKGHQSTLEWVTDFLRDYVPGGEDTTAFVREKFYKDAFLNTSTVTPSEGLKTSNVGFEPPGTPAYPLVNPDYEDHYLIPKELGITLENEVENKVAVGRWYPVKDQSGIFVSIIQPKLVSEEVIRSQQGQVNSLDDVESSALAYLIAFDLKQFDMGFALGTDHPRVDWSDRAQESVRDESLPGPDGIGTVEPLINTGILRKPSGARHVVATFTGGFKRYHSAFKWGDLALKNHGSHYGFIENGVVMSKLQPGLSTAIVFADGTVELKTWTEHDDADLARIRHARQNGVPIIEYDETTGISKPGALVTRWGAGNWSGSADQRFRTLRAGMGLQEHEGSRFLIYGYFSSATPSAMARVFQAYQCKYAMHLDMNALEHTYLAIYQMQGSQFLVQHLIEEMNVLDKSVKGQVIPRFVGYADNRDFFYFIKKDAPVQVVSTENADS